MSKDTLSEEFLVDKLITRYERANQYVQCEPIVQDQASRSHLALAALRAGTASVLIRYFFMTVHI